MREKARDKGRLEDIIEYSHNVMKLIEGIQLRQVAVQHHPLSPNLVNLAPYRL